MSIEPIIIFSSSIIILLIYLEHLVWKQVIHVDYAGWVLKLLVLSILANALLGVPDTLDIAAICGLSLLAILIMYQLFMFRSSSIIRFRFRRLIIMFLTYLLLVLALRELNQGLIILSLFILGIADSISGLISDGFGKRFFQLTHDKKSVSGIIFFGVLTFVILIFENELINSNFRGIAPPPYFNTLNVMFVTATVIIVTSFKAVSSTDWENFYIPVSIAVMLYIFSDNPSMELLIQFYIGMGIAAVIAFISYKLRFLTAGGSVATFLLASFIFGLGGLQWSIPIMTFFILSSLLSKIRKKSNREVEDYFEKTGVRDHFQVLANGGLGGVLVIIYHIIPDDLYFLMYLSSLSAVCADTWATEFGTMRKAKTYNILSFKPVPQGVSGGVSLPGTFGALLGSIIIALSGCYWFNENFLLYFLIVIIAGLFGSFFDSLLGATIQVQFECEVCRKITEKAKHCGSITKYYRGFNWITNDVVNALAAIAGIIVVYIFWYIGP